MSITKFRGCFSAAGPPVAILIGVVLVVGFLYNDNSPDGGGRDVNEQRMLGTPAFSVGGFDVYEGELSQYVQQARQQAVSSRAGANQLPELTPDETLRLYTGALQRGLYLALESNLAKREGIATEEDDVRKMAEDSAQKSIAGARAQAESQSKIMIQIYQGQIDQAKKKNPNDPSIKDLEKKLAEAKKMTPDEAVKQQLNGMTPDEAMARFRESIDKMMQDPFDRRVQIGGAAYEMTRRKYESQVDVSDKALKDSFDKFTLKQIVLTGDDSKTRAEQVLAKIKGGMDFQEAATQFTTQKTADGKPDVADQTKTRLDILAMDSLKGLLALKPGDVSEVIEAGTAATIYKLVGVKPDVPKDFEATKAQKAETVKGTLSSGRVANALEAERKAAKGQIQWKDESWQLAYDWSDLREGDKSKELMGAQNKAKRVEALKAIVERSKTTLGSVPDVPALVRYAAVNQLDVETTAGPDKDKLQTELAEAYAGIVDLVASTQVRFDYALLLIGQKKGDPALDQLLEAARSAFPPSERTAGIISKVEKYLPMAANLATKGSKVVADIQSELDQWHTDDADRKKDELERLKLEEEQKKANQAEIDRLKKEDGKKNPAAQPPPTTPPAPKPSVPESKPGG